MDKRVGEILGKDPNLPQQNAYLSPQAYSLALAKSASTGQAFKTGVTDRGSQYLRGEFLKFIE